MSYFEVVNKKTGMIRIGKCMYSGAGRTSIVLHFERPIVVDDGGWVHEEMSADFNTRTGWRMWWGQGDEGDFDDWRLIYLGK